MNHIHLLFFICLLFHQKTFSQNIEKEDAQKPNIIFILVDDQGYGDVGVFHQNERAEEGKPHHSTPHLDQMAKEGAMLTEHYSASPVCAPSRASLISGVSQGHANVRDNQFDKALEDNYSMPNTLKEMGYNTAIIGKWGLQGADDWDKNGDEWPARPRERSFDYFFGYMRHSDGHEHYPKEGVYRGQKEVWENDAVITDKLDKSYTTDLWTAAAKNYIKNHNTNQKDEPFFLYLAYDTPHAVQELPTQEYPKGGGLDGGIQWVGEDGNFINTASGKVDSYVHPDYADATYNHPDSSASELPWPETYKRYATANRRIDDGVGDLLQLLKDLDIDSNTLVVYTSDNGVANETYLGDWQAEEEEKLPTFFASYGPFDGIKRDTWEGGLRVPTIVRWPENIPDGQKIEQPNIQYDWAPTFLDAAGMVAPARMDGVSLLPSLTGTGNQLNSSIYVEYFFDGKTPDFEDFTPDHRNRTRKHMQNIRIGDFMGVRYDIQSANDGFEIYNVKEDPQQTELLSDTDDKLSYKESNLFGETVSNELTPTELERYMKESVLQRRLPADDITRPYDHTLIPPAQTNESNLTNGLNWYFYKGDFPWIPQVSTLESDASGSVDQIKSIDDESENGVMVYSGYIRLPLDGEYTFTLKSNNPAFLRVHDIQAIDADYDFSEEDRLDKTLLLKSGLHPITLYYQQDSEKTNDVELQWSGPGIINQEVNKNTLFKTEDD